jgi:hypothetical protein
MVEEILANFGDYLVHAKVAIYSVLAVLLFCRRAGGHCQRYPDILGR